MFNILISVEDISKITQFNFNVIQKLVANNCNLLVKTSNFTEQNFCIHKMSVIKILKERNDNERNKEQTSIRKRPFARKERTSGQSIQTSQQQNE